MDLSNVYYCNWVFKTYFSFSLSRYLKLIPCNITEDSSAENFNKSNVFFCWYSDHAWIVSSAVGGLGLAFSRQRACRWWKHKKFQKRELQENLKCAIVIDYCSRLLLQKFILELNLNALNNYENFKFGTNKIGWNCSVVI